MATAVIWAKTLQDLNDKKFPEDAIILENWEGVDDSKVENFGKVVQVLENIEMSSSEKGVVASLGKMFGKREDSHRRETIGTEEGNREKIVKKIKAESKTTEVVVE